MTQATEARKPNAWWVALVSGMASYIDAAAIISFGTALVIYQGAVGLSPAEVGLASGALTLGVAVGALVGGRLGDRFGRRPIFTVTMVAIVAATLILILSPGFPILVTGALVLGLATGADLPVSLSTIAEAGNDTNRGRLLGLSNLLWLFGAIVPGFLAAGVAHLGLLGGQILFAHIGVVALLVMVARLTIPESVQWSEARAAGKTRGIRPSGTADAVKVLFRAPYVVPFLALVVFYSLINLVANTNGQYSTYLLVNAGGLDISLAAVIGLPVLPLTIIGFLWFMKIADSPRRFTYFRVGAVLWVIGLAVPAVFGFTVTTYLVSLVLGVAGTAFSFETIMKVWAQEQFPTAVRATAQGTIIGVARFVAAIFASVTPLLVSLGPNLLYAILAILAAAGLATAWIVFRTRDQHNEFVLEADGADADGVDDTAARSIH